MKHRGRILLGAVVIVGLMAPVAAFSSGTATAAPWGPWGKAPTPYTCTGGDFQTGTFSTIPSGTYASITVKGACQPAPNAVIKVFGDVVVAPHAVLDAQTFPSTITVGHDVLAGSGSLLGLGCLPDPVGHTTGHPCTDPQTGQPSETAGSSAITVNGSVIAWDADTVLLNGITVRGNVALLGGGGQIPWSIKTNTICGSLIVANATPDWLGVLVNKVGGSVILANVHITDTDPNPAIFVASNAIGQNLGCWGLSPAVSGGFTGESNTVGGRAFGQCAHLTTESPGITS